MNILFITPSYKPAYIYGGPTMSVSQLAQTLLLAKALVTVYTTTANGEEELNVVTAKPLNVDGVSVFYFSRWTKDHTHFSPVLVWRVFRDCKKYDVVHIQSWWNLVSILSVVVCWLRGIKPVLSPRGMLSSYSFQHQKTGVKQFFHGTIGKFLLARTILHATSQLEKEECLVINNTWKNFVLPNVVRLPETNEQVITPPDKNEFNIGFLSRIDRKKGIEVLMKALAEFRVPFRLFIAGSGSDHYMNELKQLGNAIGISDRVEWVGWIDGNDKFTFLRKLDLLALTSYNENFANVVVESLSVGTPVLLSEKVGLSDYVANEKMGWITTMEVPAISEALRTAYEEKRRRDEIRVQAPVIIRKTFTGADLARKYVEKYNTFAK